MLGKIHVVPLLAAGAGAGEYERVFPTKATAGKQAWPGSGAGGAVLASDDDIRMVSQEAKTRFAAGSART
jgi:hypothetical protein